MFISFPDPTIIEVSGTHASRYLQNRLSNDIKALPPGHGACVAAALSAQGKIQALFTVLATAADCYLLICEAGDSQEILARLTQFKVAERVEFVDMSAQFMLLRWEAPSPDDALRVFPRLQALPTPGTFAISNDAYIVGQAGLTEVGILCLIPKEHSTATHAAISQRAAQLAGDAVRIARIRHNLPSFPDELGQDLLLSEADLSHTVSFTKGCYVGQEVVAKIDALGRAPRRLLPFGIPGRHLDLLDAPITQEHDPVSRSFGRVLTAVFDPLEDQTVGFIVIKNDPAVIQSRLCANGRTLFLLSISDG